MDVEYGRGLRDERKKEGQLDRQRSEIIQINRANIEGKAGANSVGKSS